MNTTTKQADDRLMRARLLLLASAGASIALGTLVIFGWLTHRTPLVQLAPNLVPMQFNTALGFILSGIALLMVYRQRKWHAILFGSTAALLALTTLIEYISGTDLLIDQFFLTHYIVVETASPGRMAPNTALGFLFVGSTLALAGGGRSHRTTIWLGAIMGSLAAAAGAVALVGYSIDIRPAYHWGIGTGMAPHTAVGFIVLGAGLIGLAWLGDASRVATHGYPKDWMLVSTGIGLSAFTIGLANALQLQELRHVALATRHPADNAGNIAMVFGLVMSIAVVSALWQARRARNRANAAEDALQKSREASARAQFSEEYCAQALENLYDAVITIDVGGIIKVFNPAAEKLFGHTARAIIGHKVEALMPEPDHSRHDTYIANYLKTGEAKIIGLGREVMALHANGRTFPIWLSVSEMTVAGEDQFIASIHDLSEQRKLEEQLNQARKLEAIGQFTSGVAHDFNNLLTVIIGNLALLREDLESSKNVGPGEILDMIGPALAASQRGADLTHRLLGFARRQALDSRSLSAREEIEKSVILLKRIIRESITLRMIDRAGDWKFRADPGMLANALLNLAGNARDAMVDGGELTLEAAQADREWITAHRIHGLKKGDYVRLSVHDTGKGIAPDMLAKVFDPFFTTKEPGKGTGLGLSTVHGFAAQSGGCATINSHLGQGTTVSLFFPRCEFGTGTERPAVAQTTDDTTRPMTILVVEDEAEIRTLVEEILSRMGHSVSVAETGEKAIDRLKHGESFDVLLTDVVLPGGLSGIDVAVAARRILADIPIIFMTGFAGNALLDPGAFSPRAQLISKPFTGSQLAKKLALIPGPSS